MGALTIDRRQSRFPRRVHSMKIVARWEMVVARRSGMGWNSPFEPPPDQIRLAPIALPGELPFTAPRFFASNGALKISLRARPYLAPLFPSVESIMQ